MTLTYNSKKILFITSIFMAVTIAIGAFGAHGLKAIVHPNMLKVFHTGVEYSFYNILGVFALGILLNFKENSKKFYLAILFIILGTFLFSFSLYALVLFDMPKLGIITPIGGSTLIISWLFVAYYILRDK